MTIQESKSIGGKQILKAAFFLIVLYEISLLYKQTEGDFANGMLFFLSIQTNGFFIMFIIAYFACMFLAGRQVGYIIFKTNKRNYSIAILYSFITTLLTIGLFFLTTFLATYEESKNLSKQEIMMDVLKMSLVLLIPMTLAWLWTVYRIKAKMGIT